MKCYESKAANWQLTDVTEATLDLWEAVKSKNTSAISASGSLRDCLFNMCTNLTADVITIMNKKKMLTFKISQSIFILPYSKKQKSLISCVVSERVSEWVLQWMTRAEWMTSDRTIKRVSQRGNEKNSRGSEWVSERVGERGSTLWYEPASEAGVNHRRPTSRGNETPLSTRRASPRCKSPPAEVTAGPSSCVIQLPIQLLIFMFEIKTLKIEIRDEMRPTHRGIVMDNEAKRTLSSLFKGNLLHPCINWW